MNANNLLTAESYLASIATKVGVGVNLLGGSPQGTDIEASDSSLPSRGGASSSEIKENLEDRKKEKVEEKREEKTKAIPIVFHWDHGGNEVYVCGTFSNWEKIPMNKR